MVLFDYCSNLARPSSPTSPLQTPKRGNLLDPKAANLPKLTLAPVHSAGISAASGGLGKEGANGHLHRRGRVADQHPRNSRPISFAFPRSPLIICIFLSALFVLTHARSTSFLTLKNGYCYTTDQWSCLRQAAATANTNQSGTCKASTAGLAETDFHGHPVGRDATSPGAG